MAFLPPYSPGSQPAERLWPMVDETVADRLFATLDAAVARRVRRLGAGAIKPRTGFRRRPPRPTSPR